MASWANPNEMREIEIPPHFPIHIQAATITFHSTKKAVGDVEIKQILWFRPKPELGKYPNYSINGDVIVDGKPYGVCCFCHGEDLPVFQHHPEKMVFDLMAFESIPESWRKS